MRCDAFDECAFEHVPHDENVTAGRRYGIRFYLTIEGSLMYAFDATVSSVYWSYFIANENFPEEPPRVERSWPHPALGAAKDLLVVGTWSDEEPVRVRVEVGNDCQELDPATWEVTDEARWSVTGPVTITETDFYPASPPGIIPTEPGEYDVKLWARRRGFSSSLNKADAADFAEEHLIQLRPVR